MTHIFLFRLLSLSISVSLLTKSFSGTVTHSLTNSDFPHPSPHFFHLHISLLLSLSLSYVLYYNSPLYIALLTLEGNHLTICLGHIYSLDNYFAPTLLCYRIYGIFIAPFSL